MDRLACVDLPAFALQLLRRLHPDWAGLPAAVVSKESPNGEVLAICERARRQGVLPGLRYAAALALAPDLRAGEVLPSDLALGVGSVTEQLKRFTPDVEPKADEPGAFWVNAAGLYRINASLHSWAGQIRARLGQMGLAASVAVGFTRFGTYALARARQGVLVVDTPDREAAWTRRVPLSRLGLAPTVLTGLTKLGKHTTGDLLDLPDHGLLERFGPGLYALSRLAAGKLWRPLQPVAHEAPIAGTLDLDAPVGDATTLTFLIKRVLGPLLETVDARHQKLARLEICLKLDHAGKLEEEVRPAAPTLDEAQLIDLVRLRLETLNLTQGVEEIGLTAGTVPAITRQLELLAQRPRRDLAAAERSFARLRAEFGPDAVVTAKLTEGHLPEAHFTFEPLHRFCLPGTLAPATERPLVRRIFTRPRPLQPRPVCGPRGCHLDGMGSEPIAHLKGPYIVSGGWWARDVEREYHFAETERGNISWIYFDRKRHRWFIHGEVV